MPAHQRPGRHLRRDLLRVHAGQAPRAPPPPVLRGTHVLVPNGRILSPVQRQPLRVPAPHARSCAEVRATSSWENRMVSAGLDGSARLSRAPVRTRALTPSARPTRTRRSPPLSNIPSSSRVGSSRQRTVTPTLDGVHNDFAIHSRRNLRSSRNDCGTRRGDSDRRPTTGSAHGRCHRGAALTCGRRSPAGADGSRSRTRSARSRPASRRNVHQVEHLTRCRHRVPAHVECRSVVRRDRHADHDVLIVRTVESHHL